jgi:hypothetical protein
MTPNRPSDPAGPNQNRELAAHQEMPGELGCSRCPNSNLSEVRNLFLGSIRRSTFYQNPVVVENKAGEVL